MTLVLWTAGLSVVSFLLGGIPFGLLLGLLKGVDVRKAGSGNIGAANVGRLLGRAWGIAVFALDAAKGLLATVLAGFVLGGLGTDQPLDSMTTVCWLFAGLCAVFGHNYSPYLGFKGGKGVATSLGVALGVYPFLTLPAIVAFFVWVIGVALSRMSSVGSLSAALAFPIFVIVYLFMREGAIGPRWPLPAFAVLTCLLVFVRHRANIRRILSGTESRLDGQKAAQSASSDTSK